MENLFYDVIFGGMEVYGSDDVTKSDRIL